MKTNQKLANQLEQDVRELCRRDTWQNRNLSPVLIGAHYDSVIDS